MSELELDLKNKVVVFTTHGCPYSARILKTLQILKIQYEEIKISSYPVGFLAVDQMLSVGGQLSIPRVFANNVCVGVCFSFSNLLSLGVTEFISSSNDRLLKILN